MEVPEELIPEHACWELLATASVGCLALSVRALPVILPVQYYLDGRRLGCGRCWCARAGTVEVDESYIGGEEPGLRGGRAASKKVLTGIAVEVNGAGLAARASPGYMSGETDG